MQKTEISDAAPSSLDEFVGQSGIVDQVRIALNAAQADEKRLDHMIFTGSPGLGKSQMAHIIAAEMGTNFFEVLGQSLKSDAELNSLLLKAEDRDIIHLDEAHLTPRHQQTALLMALDRRCINLSAGKKVVTLPIKDFTLLMSTTDEFLLINPLRDRMKLILHYDYNNEEELGQIIEQRCLSLNWDFEYEILEEIAKRAKGTPRLALRLLQAARRVARAEGKQKILLKHMKKVFQLENLDDLGLGSVEQQYLRLLIDGGQKLNILSSMLGLPVKTISDVVEPFLLRAGLIIKGENGRVLTQKGIDHIQRGGLT
jgi:Holliday junction DNA helicase RuvB